jgi:Ca2+-binding RTX toxin-like protein
VQVDDLTESGITMSLRRSSNTAFLRTPRRISALLAGALVVISSSGVGAIAMASTQVRCGGLVATIVGTDGDDVLAGTDGNDVIAGLGGSDLIVGYAGKDTLCGGSGHTALLGGDGNDTLITPGPRSG